MKTDRALLIVGQDMQTPSHHRGEHLARFLANRFVELDMISVTKMHDGPGTDPVLKKAFLGIRDIIFKRIKVIRTGNVINYVVRFPRLPIIIDYLARDFWTYASLGGYLDRDYDLCILSHPRLAYVAMRLKQRGKVGTLVYDDWDYFPGEFPHIPFWQLIMDRREQMCVRISDGVVSVSTSLEELRKRQGARRTTVVSNGVDYSLFKVAQHKGPHPPTLIYMGTLGNEWGADLPIRALNLIKEAFPDVRYLILGTGSEESRLRALTSELGLESSVYFLGNHAYQDLPRFLAEADIGVATSRENDFRRYASPLKIFEYMAAGLPVISTNFGEGRQIIERAGAGLAVEFSPRAFAAAALDLFCNPERYRLLSANAIDFASQHDWEVLLQQELGFIKGLT